MADMPKPEGSLCIHCLSATCCGERLREQLEAARRCIEAADDLPAIDITMNMRERSRRYEDARSEFDRVMGKNGSEGSKQP